MLARNKKTRVTNSANKRKDLLSLCCCITRSGSRRSLARKPGWIYSIYDFNDFYISYTLYLCHERWQKVVGKEARLDIIDRWELAFLGQMILLGQTLIISAQNSFIYSVIVLTDKMSDRIITYWTSSQFTFIHSTHLVEVLLKVSILCLDCIRGEQDTGFRRTVDFVAQDGILHLGKVLWYITSCFKSNFLLVSRKVGGWCPG